MLYANLRYPLPKGTRYDIVKVHDYYCLYYRVHSERTGNNVRHKRIMLGRLTVDRQWLIPNDAWFEHTGEPVPEGALRKARVRAGRKAYVDWSEKLFFPPVRDMEPDYEDSELLFVTPEEKPGSRGQYSAYRLLSQAVCLEFGLTEELEALFGSGLVRNRQLIAFFWALQPAAGSFAGCFSFDDFQQQHNSASFFAPAGISSLGAAYARVRPQERDSFLRNRVRKAARNSGLKYFACSIPLPDILTDTTKTTGAAGRAAAAMSETSEMSDTQAADSTNAWSRLALICALPHGMPVCYLEYPDAAGMDTVPAAIQACAEPLA